MDARAHPSTRPSARLLARLVLDTILDTRRIFNNPSGLRISVDGSCRARALRHTEVVRSIRAARYARARRDRRPRVTRVAFRTPRVWHNARPGFFLFFSTKPAENGDTDTPSPLPLDACVMDKIRGALCVGLRSFFTLARHPNGGDANRSRAVFMGRAIGSRSLHVRRAVSTIRSNCKMPSGSNVRLTLFYRVIQLISTSPVPLFAMADGGTMTIER